eukprot:CAMPEP_0178581244 /NCGR_PEP_ID=MMETSP0697-20121206/23065_1 /TAXON_ID=265572 /ORGANISM="Extubocellulus spinifer, Strain CCMP396" /LENGTH=810 /DNA_ID=CAMNT_0020216851 /DNA_START=331 /DNA_END=2763 /DNA_ORIENTATION=+
MSTAQKRAAPQSSSGGNSAAAAAATAAPPLQFDSNMDWPSSSPTKKSTASPSTSSRPPSSSAPKAATAQAPEAEAARNPPPFPTATISPCARITTPIYNPKYDRIETVRDVLVEVAGPGRDGLGRPIIFATSASVSTSAAAGGSAGGGQPSVAVAQAQAQGKSQAQARSQASRPRAQARAQVGIGQHPSFDGAGFTGAGVTTAGVVPGSAGLMSGVAQQQHQHGGQPVAAVGQDDDDSMSSGWSSSDSEMSMTDVDPTATSAATAASSAARGGGGANVGGPTMPNPIFAQGQAGGGGQGQAHHQPHQTHHQQHQTQQQHHQQLPQRAYWLQRTLREAIYGRVRYGVVLKRREVPYAPAAPTGGAQRSRSWNEPFTSPSSRSGVASGGQQSQQPVVEWEVTEEKCAVKEMSWQHIRKERDRLAEDPIKEVSAMQYLKRYLAACSSNPQSLDTSDAMLSTHIMLPLDLLSDDRYLYSVMPYCDGGELFDRLDVRSKFTEDEARYWMHQILDGLDNLQRAGICHRDMSLENLLVHKDRICLIIDMGMCLRIPYEGSRDDGEDLFMTTEERIGGGRRSGGYGYAGGGGAGVEVVLDSDGNAAADDDRGKRPRALSANTELRQSFKGIDLGRGGSGSGQGGGGGAGTAMENGGGRTAAANATAGAVAAGQQRPCPPDIRQRKRYLIKPNGTCGKWHYMSPEIAQNKVPFDGHAVDVWAIGVILFLMITGFPPWERPCRTDERFKYMTAGYLVQMLTEWELGLSPDAMDLLQRMMWIDPRDRLSLAQVRAHPWMNNGPATLPSQQNQQQAADVQMR